MTITRLPEIVFPITQVNKVNEIVDVLNDNLNMYYSVENPQLVPVEGVATWTVTHNLGTENVNCSLYNGDILVLSKIAITSENVVTVSLNSDATIAEGTYKIVIISNGAGSSSGGGSYTLPTASTTTLGGVRIDGSSITINNGVISSTVDSEYPKIYIAQGAIATIQDNSAKFYGLATVTLYGSGVAFIDFVYRCIQATSKESYNWGLDSQALHSINSNIPLITPTSGAGHWIAYVAQPSPYLASTSFDSLGYATSFVEDSSNRYWLPNRIGYANGSYTNATTEFAISANTFAKEKVCIKGTAYGTFTVS